MEICKKLQKTSSGCWVMCLLIEPWSIKQHGFIGQWKEHRKKTDHSLFLEIKAQKLAAKCLAALHKFFLDKVIPIACTGYWGKGSQLHAEITGNAREKSHSTDYCGNSFRPSVKLSRQNQWQVLTSMSEGKLNTSLQVRGLTVALSKRCWGNRKSFK